MPSITFDLCPELSFTRIGGRRAVGSNAEIVSSQRRQVVDRELPVYHLRWSHAHAGIVETLLRYWEQTSYGIHPMNYTPPGETEREVRMLGPFQYQQVGPTTASIEIRLEVVR